MSPYPRFPVTLTVTFLPNDTGLPGNVNPAFNPYKDLVNIKVQELQSNQTLCNVGVYNNGVTTRYFSNVAVATEFQNYITDILVDLGQAVPTFEIS